MPASLERQIGVVSATAFVVGEVIAVGIFLTPAQMIRSLGSPALVLIERPCSMKAETPPYLCSPGIKLIIQPIPKRSVTIPKRGDQKVFASGMRTCPP